MARGSEAAGVRDRAAGCATDREVGVVAAVLVAGSEKVAAYRRGLSHSTVKHRGLAWVVGAPYRATRS